MIFIESSCNDAAYHFSVEELFMRYKQKEVPVLMIWQTEKTVMLGNNQTVKDEVNTDAAYKAGVKIIRRSSGGGAIYTDLGAVQYSVIEPLLHEAKIHREEAASSILKALNALGIPATREGHNDILAGGRKISGFAQYTSGGFVCTHGSLLFDSDLEFLAEVLLAREEKLRPKGITSIRSRVANIKPYIDNWTVGEFVTTLQKSLLNGKNVEVHRFSENELEMISALQTEKYSNDEWNLRM